MNRTQGALKLPGRSPEAEVGIAVPRYSEQLYLPHRHSTNICLREGETESS